MRAEASAVAAPPVAVASEGSLRSRAPQAPGSFELDLDVFDGPFDLLVTLILRDEIDIWEVRVSRIIAEYIVHLADTGEFDLDATSQFVVLVAALLEMKSRLLLEEDVQEELEDLDPDEAARQLLERLVRYSEFRNAAGALRTAWEEHSARLYRNAPVPRSSSAGAPRCRPAVSDARGRARPAAARTAGPRHQPPCRPRRLARQGAAAPAAHPRR